MDIQEQLRILQEAQGDSAQLALATIDIAHPALSESDRMILKDALKAAAIPHWCDAAILAALLQISQSASVILLERLRSLNCMESFPARGANVVNVHEATRLILRKQMACDQPIFFRSLSIRAQAYFESDISPAGRIEWIYHFLIADPDRGATACEVLNRQWRNQGHPEDRYALALALNELETSKLLQGRARIAALLCIGETRSYRGETAQLELFSQEILRQAKQCGYATGAARANALLGGSFQAQGRLDEAKVAFEECLRISVQLAEQDPSNADWQRDLAVSHNRIGAVLRAQGRLTEAQAAFDKSLRINHKLVEQDPSNADWQLGLAVSHNRIGAVLQAQGRLAEAKAAFDKGLRINHKLVEQDPSNAGWQRDLAAAHNQIGNVLQAQGRFAEAQVAFEEDLRISVQLAKQDPSNAYWQRDLAVSHNRIGDLLQAQGRLAEAQVAFDAYFRISDQLAKQDPSNAGWQRGLAVAHNWIGAVLQAQGRLAEAKAAFDECLRISRQLAKQDPSNVDWQRDLAIAQSRVNAVLLAIKMGQQNQS